jgi:hypothetical protein
MKVKTKLVTIDTNTLEISNVKVSGDKTYLHIDGGWEEIANF